MIKKTFFTILFTINVSAADHRPDVDSKLNQQDYDKAFQYYKNLYRKGVEGKIASFVATAMVAIDNLFQMIGVGAELIGFKDKDKAFEKEVNVQISELQKNKNVINFDQLEIIEPKKKNKNKKKKKKVDENAQNELDDSLHKFCARGDLQKVKELLALGANLEAKRFDGRTPLHTAIAHCRLDIFKFLINVGAKVSTETEMGITPLHIAAQGAEDKLANTEMVYILINYVSNGVLNKCTKRNGWNALHIAAAYGNIEVVKLLITAGIDHTVLTKKSLQTPYQLAQEFNQKEVVDYLSKLK